MTGFQRKGPAARTADLRQGDLWHGPGMPPDEADALVAAEVEQYRRTNYPTVAPLLDFARSMGWLENARCWADPMAGDGVMVDHVARWCRETGHRPPGSWLLVEIRDVPELQERARFDVRVCCPLDLHLYQSVMGSRGPLVNALISNLPWPDWTREGHIPAMQAAFPGALIMMLSCDREPLDAMRWEPFFANPPHWQLSCAGRQTFGDAKTAYPHPVSWYVWLPEPHPGHILRWGLPPYVEKSATLPLFPEVTP